MNRPFAALAVSVFLVASTVAHAGTDGNGFFDSYLVAIGYDAAGGAPPVDQLGQDYLCDGESNEETIIPDEFTVLFPPIDAGNDPALCGSKPPALRGFDENALLDPDGNLPVTFQTVNNTTLDFRGIVRNAVGDNNLTPSNVMAYAWVYITNNTEESLDLLMGIGSDDSIVVELNRVEVFRHRGGRGSGGNGTIQDRFPVTLQPGGNIVQFKVWQGGGGWNMRARIEMPSDCPDDARAPRDPVLSDPAGLITVEALPPIDDELFEPTRSQRAIAADGVSPEAVTATITVEVDHGGTPWSLREHFDAGWELVSADPAASSSSPGNVRWDVVNVGAVTYTLRRSDEWNAEDGAVSGTFTIDGATQPVAGDGLIPGGLQPFVQEVLLTASLNLADFDELGNPIDVNGCNVSEAQINGAWIVGEDGDANEIDDASIVPSEGMEILIDWGGASGGSSQADQSSFISPEAEERFWSTPGDPFSSIVLNRVASDAGLFNYQRTDIFGPVDQTMSVAYFYALNTSNAARKVVIAFRSDDSGGVRVNGRPTFAIPACRGTGNFGNADRFEAQLDPGKNLIAVYTFESGGGYGMRIRLENERFEPIRLPTTLNPDGYDPSPAAHPDPGPLQTFGLLYVPAVLVTAAFDIGGGFTGTNIPTSAIEGDWITGVDSAGNPVDDATIVPSEGMQLFPDYNGASQAAGLTLIAESRRDTFWTDPIDPTAGSRVVRVTSGDGFYNWQRANIYTNNPNPNVTMNVAWFYAINEEAEPRCVTLSFGSDDSGGVRVNGRVAHAITAGRGTPQFDASDKVKVQLDPGKNLISCYTFDNTGGWGLRVRFEEEDGAPLDIPTTTDPAGYDPDPALHPEPPPECRRQQSGDAYVRGGAANGIVTQFLVPLEVFDHTGGGRTLSNAAPENYVSQAGQPPSAGTIFEGAVVEAGIEGIENGSPAITTGVRGSACGTTTLVLFDGLIQGDGPNDPGDFNSNRFYSTIVGTTNDTTQFSASLFFFIENLTNGELDAWFAFASDDGASLFVNGELVVEHLPGRGRGGNNVLQTFAGASTPLDSGLNFVQLSYKQGGGGSGARVGFFADECFSEAFGADEVRVSANPPDFQGGITGVSATRTVSTFGCDGVAMVTLTINTRDGGEADVELEEVLPAGLSGSNPSAGAFNDDGSVLSFSGRVADGTQITYTLSGAISGVTFCEARINGAPIRGEDTLDGDTCPTRCLPLTESGGVPELLIVGPIDLGGDPGALCDDNGNFEVTDYLAGGGISEENAAPVIGEELQPDFGGEAGGVGVKAAANPAINPRADEGVLTVWLADADADGAVDLGRAENIGAADNYVAYGVTYLDNTTDAELAVTIEIGSDDAFKAVLNGEVLGSLPICRALPAPGAGDRFQAFLAPGRNTLLVGITQRGGGAAIRVMVRDEFDLPFIDGSVVACRSFDDDLPPVGTPFRRGDTTGDGNLNITDAVKVFGVLFLGDPAPGCQETLDANNDGDVNITDGIRILGFLFLGQPPPAAPGHEACGLDPDEPGSPGDLGCESYDGC